MKPGLTIMANGQRSEIWPLVGRVQWSGTKSQAARSLRFDLLSSERDKNLPAVNCPLGARVALQGDGLPLFQGTVVSRTLATGGGSMRVDCLDAGMYLANNQGNYRFRGTTPEAAAAQICADFGIPAGYFAPTGIRLDRRFSGSSLWTIIISMYTLAGRQNGKRYQARFSGTGQLEVVERLEKATNLVIQPGSNLISAATTESIEHMSNSVAICDKNGRLLQVVEDKAAIKLYGLMQSVLTQGSRGEDLRAEAKALLEDRGLEQTVNVECLGDPSLITGSTVVVKQPYTGLHGIFWLEADKHQWVSGQYRTTLTLNCRNVAYEQEGGSKK